MKPYLYIGLLSILMLGACSKSSHSNDDGHNHSAQQEHSDHDGHDHGSEASGEHATAGGDEIVMTKAQAQAAGVEVSYVNSTTLSQVIATSGQVMVAQGDESMTVANVAGIVSFNGTITPGKAVSRGTPLVSISSKNLADGDPVQRTKIAYEVARKEYERMKSLVASQIVSQKEFAIAQQNFENARISYEAISGGSSGNGVVVKAPINGFVKSVLVAEGDYVSIGQPLVSVAQNSKLFLRADVAEKYYQDLNNIRSANFQTPYDNKVYQLTDLNGKLLSVGKTAQGNSFYVPVTFEFDNKGSIIPGSFVEIFLLGNPIENVIALPRSALTEEQGLYFVYIQMDDEGYRKQEVTLGIDNGAEVQILSGVKPGDAVVTAGAYQVKLASASAALPSHSH